ncbi:transposase [Nonomuraea wenchangensis]|uniref:transposase n=1 Tax=Nonomuraea wenchangensis TaxID=568860 RepID=UPI00384EBCD5
MGSPSRSGPCIWPRSGAIKARTACINELRSLLVTAPAELRERMAGTSAQALATACPRLRPAADLTDPLQGTKHALRSLARRYQALTAEIEDLDAHLAALVAQARPELLAVHGVGPETAALLLITCGDNPDRLTSSAAFAALCGVAPIPASSGKTTRQRLSRGGDRQANRALYLIVLARMAWCPRTRAYVTRCTAEGKSKKRSSAASNAASPESSSKSSPVLTPQAMLFASPLDKHRSIGAVHAAVSLGRRSRPA